MGMMQDCHPDHTWFQMWSSPQDFGFDGLGRRRTWAVGSHNTRSTCRFDPFQVKEEIISAFQSESVTTEISDYLIATKADVTMEAKEMAQRRGVLFRPDSINDLSYMMTPRELESKLEMDNKYVLLTGRRPETDRNLVYNLADSVNFGVSWSGTSGRIPTYRVNAKSSWYWLPHYGRFMCSRERLMSMGWPVAHPVARAMGCPLVGCSDTKRASDLAGNAMHFQSAGIMQLISLARFGPA